MALFGMACALSPTLSLLSLFPLSACIQSRVAEAVAVIKVFPTVTAAQLISTAVCVQSSCCPAEGLLL